MPSAPAVPDHELFRVVGRGAYGDVWLGRNIMGTWRAVKVVHRERFDSERPYEREFSGIQSYEPISRSCDGLVQILHVGRDEGAGCFYYVMQLADDAHEGSAGLRKEGSVAVGSPETYQARTLRLELFRRRSFSPAEVMALGSSLATGLSHLHSNGLVHRDVKPSNIIFVHGRARLADIGLVRSLGEVGEGRTFVGTEGYIPPEGPGRPEADIYALGLVLYEALTGFPRDRFPEIPPQWVRGAVEHRAALEVFEIVLKACEGEVKRRYRTAAALQADLALLQSGQSVQQARELARKARVFRRLAVMGGIGVAVAAAVASFTSWREREAMAVSRREMDLRQRAELAQVESQRQVKAAEYAQAAAKVAQAAAVRRSGQAGQRTEALRLLAGAVPSWTNRLELRREAAAAILLPDITLNPPTPRHTPDGDRAGFEPSLREALTLARDGTLRWISPTGDPAPFTLEHPRGWKALGTLPQLPGTNRFAAAVYADGARSEMLYWNLEYRAPVATFTNFNFLTDRFYTSADGRTLAFVRHKGAGVELRQLEKAGPRSRFLEVRGATGAYPSPDGAEMLVAVQGDGPATMQVVMLGNFARRGVIPVSSPVSWCNWSYDGRWLATRSEDSRLRIWDMESMRLRRELPGSFASDSHACFVPGSPVLATSGWHARFNLWDPLSGRSLVEMRVTGSEFQLGANGRDLVLWGWDTDDLIPGSMQLRRPFVELASLSVGEGLEERMESRRAAFSPDERWLAVAGTGGTEVWDWTATRLAGQVTSPESYDAWWQPDGRSLRTQDESGARVWPVELEGGSFRLGQPAALDAFTNHCGLAAHSADGSVRAFWFRDRLVVTAPGRRETQFPLKVTPSRVELSPDGRLLGLSYWKDLALVLQVSDGRKLWSHRSRPSCDLCFSPDGRWLVSGSGDEIQFWSVADFSKGRRIARDGYQGNHGPVAFSPDGRYFAYANTRTEVVLTAAATGEELIRFENASGWQLSALVFSASGNRLAGVSLDRVTTVWNLEALNRDLGAIDLAWPEPAPGK